jgi:hypothetical protein
VVEGVSEDPRPWASEPVGRKVAADGGALPSVIIVSLCALPSVRNVSLCAMGLVAWLSTPTFTRGSECSECSLNVP